jgi:hypothetical protein
LTSSTTPPVTGGKIDLDIFRPAILSIDLVEIAFRGLEDVDVMTHRNDLFPHRIGGEPFGSRLGRAMRTGQRRGTDDAKKDCKCCTHDWLPITPWNALRLELRSEKWLAIRTWQRAVKFW